MTRPSKARRRFHTDRVVRNRRARYWRELPDWHRSMMGDETWILRTLSYGYLASTDPWDCGRARCGVCHYDDGASRVREKREWRRQIDSEINPR